PWNEAVSLESVVKSSHPTGCTCTEESVPFVCLSFLISTRWRVTVSDSDEPPRSPMTALITSRGRSNFPVESVAVHVADPAAPDAVMTIESAPGTQAIGTDPVPKTVPRSSLEIEGDV